MGWLVGWLKGGPRDLGLRGFLVWVLTSVWVLSSMGDVRSRRQGKDNMPNTDKDPQATGENTPEPHSHTTLAALINIAVIILVFALFVIPVLTMVF